ncbi:hypothetical protein METBIDRAFT_11432 [Metschnikowia bicuspidata var. bicuspidata NRRL YB-4993]|uniref:C2H2-type domain-containing protein n=1 Tax=Metschnikowia bicuspidata var. bicuspidata NRRL YB-4993 TaxID=869754 RepID=A0A1A0HER8_9ASCO|nr:hypothetical protein METBIDRAFT_11432 [Metschnikowia bicuspidata var. bicuspidata NRRL YB-4993]OBA22619.1 hypothetical protein METBIDRAFT_11432 [Metschnikowia bicuspidata var. bicuspidata NRRL YB-4993]
MSQDSVLTESAAPTTLFVADPDLISGELAGQSEHATFYFDQTSQFYSLPRVPVATGGTSEAEDEFMSDSSFEASTRHYTRPKIELDLQSDLESGHGPNPESGLESGLKSEHEQNLKPDYEPNHIPDHEPNLEPEHGLDHESGLESETGGKMQTPKTKRRRVWHNQSPLLKPGGASAKKEAISRRTRSREERRFREVGNVTIIIDSLEIESSDEEPTNFRRESPAVKSEIKLEPGVENGIKMEPGSTVNVLYDHGSAGPNMTKLEPQSSVASPSSLENGSNTGKQIARPVVSDSDGEDSDDIHDNSGPMPMASCTQDMATQRNNGEGNSYDIAPNTECIYTRPMILVGEESSEDDVFLSLESEEEDAGGPPSDAINQKKQNSKHANDIARPARGNEGQKNDQLQLKEKSMASGDLGHKDSLSAVSIEATKRGTKKPRASVDTLSFECSKCPHRVKNKSQLMKHLEGHGGTRKLKCRFCDWTANRLDYLDSHMCFHKEYDEVKDQLRKDFLLLGKPLGKAESSDDFKYRCDQCQMAFKRKDHLTSHIIVHSKERLFKCELCTQSFKRKLDYKSHKSICPNNMKQCPDCQKTFKNMALLERHREEHMVLKCTLCMRAFKNKRALALHQRLKHSSEEDRLQIEELEHEGQRNIRSKGPQSGSEEELGDEVKQEQQSEDLVQTKEDPGDGPRSSHTLLDRARDWFH